MNPVNPTNSNNSFFHRSILFAAFCAVGIAVFWTPLYHLAVLSHNDSLYSHIILIPLFSFAIVGLKRKDFFRQVTYAPAVGATVVLAGLILRFAVNVFQLEVEQNDYLTLCIIGFVLWIIGGFVGFYGTTGLSKGNVSPAFSIFCGPAPDSCSGSNYPVFTANDCSYGGRRFRPHRVDLLAHRYGIRVA